MENVADIYPLTPVQIGILSHCVRGADASLYHSQVTFTLCGELDEERLRSAWRELLARNEVLRTFVLWEDLDEPVQVVRDLVEDHVDYADWAALDPGEQSRRFDALCAEEMSTPFELETAPLTRLFARQTAPNEWRVLWSYHHVMLDGWSSLKLMQDLLRSLRGDGGSVHRRRYRDFVAWRMQQDPAAAADHWSALLDGFDEPTRLGWRRAAVGADGSASFARHALSDAAELGAGMQAYARGQRLTTATLVHAAWALTLGRVGRSDDVVFGTTVAGRPASLTGVDEMVGLFINTLPLRCRFREGESIGQFLRALQAQQVSNGPYDSAALSDVQKLSGISGDRALFDSVVVSHDFPDAFALDAGRGIAVDDVRYEEHSHFPLALLWSTDAALGALDATLIRRTDVLDADEARALGAAFLGVLQTIVAASPEVSLDSLRLAPSDPEPGTEPRPLRTVTADIATRCRSAPNAIAVVHRDRSMTYRELDCESSELALRILEASSGLPGKVQRVGICVDDGCSYVVAILAALRGGACYVPLSPRWPQARIREIVELAEIDVVVVDGELDLPTSIQVRSLGGRAEGSRAAEAVWSDPDLDDLAYVLFTSGSTGVPKGVAVTHANLAYSNGARRDHYGSAPDAFLLLSEFTFDSSVAGLFWTLTTGGALIVASAEERRDPEALGRLMRKHNVTDTLCIPALYQGFLGLDVHAAVPTLRRVIVAGEACPPALVRSHLEARPDVELFNEYGPTEATVWCTAAKLDEAHAADVVVPIGVAPSGTRIVVTDHRGHAVPDGLAGELVVQGPGVARGYIGGTTDALFEWVDGTRQYRTGDLGYVGSDGLLRYLGRIDRQLKVRGHRVQPQEVERALLSQPEVIDAAVAAVPRRDGGGAVLVAYCVAPDEPNASDESIFAALRELLPAAMMPQQIAWLAALPRTAHGKVDTARLPEPRSTTHERRPAGSDVERALVEVWAHELGVESESIDTEADFFELGGDSIVALKVVVGARRKGLPIAPNDLFSHPSICALAMAIARRDSVDSAVRDANASEDRFVGPKLLPVARWLFAQELPMPSQWNMPLLLELEADVDTGVLRDAWTEIHAYYPALRAKYVLTQGGWELNGCASDPLAWREIEVDAVDAPPRGVLAEAQAGLDLEAGRLMSALLVRSGARRWLMLAAHHLAVDGVTWRLLVDEAALVYEAQIAGTHYTPQAESVTVASWAEMLDQSGSHFADQDVYWRDVALRARDSLGGVSSSPNLEGDALRHAVALRADATNALAAFQDTYGANVEEVLLAALASVFSNSGSVSELALTLESHGRNNPFDADLSNTIGWLTVAFPFVLPCMRVDDYGSAVVAVKEARRAVPDQGLGFGVLRHALDEEWALPRIAFNFLGRFEGSSTFGELMPPSLALADARGRDQRRYYALEINAQIAQGQLHLEWTYDPEAFPSHEIEQLASGLLDELERMIEFCVNRGERVYTPTDFSAADLDQQSLDQLLDELD
jgi:amino acid adenylation domain-containing protein/non-ribosomal peptide synthase protein (TIGR01720 family)